MTNAQVGRVAVLGLITVSGLALAACSSGPSPTQQARSSRTSAMTAAKTIHRQLSSVGTAFSAEITGGLFLCGSSDAHAVRRGPNAVQYTATQEWTLVKKGSEPLATLGRSIVQKLDAAGWQLRTAPTPNPESPAAASYTGRRDGLDMRLLEINNNPGLGGLVTIDVSASCFDTGSDSAAVKFMDTYGGDNIREPRPSATPSAAAAG